MNFFLKRRDDLSTLALRLALGSVFLWFGIDKWVHPDAWYGWVPEWLWPFLPFGIDGFIVLNGIVEFAIGLALIAGTCVRLAAGVAGAFLLAIAVVFGANEVTIRDNALMALAFALVIGENRSASKWRIPDEWIAWMMAFLVLFLFIFGVLYLRAG